MKTTFIHLKEKLINSLWFIPVLMTLASPFFAIFIFELDIYLSHIGKEVFAWIWTGNSEAAVQLFAAIVTSLVTMSALLFSVTMLVLTVVSQQYGSHILKVFRSNNFTKLVLGWFIGAIVYCMFVVTFLATLNDPDFHPQLSIIIGIAVMILSFIIFIIFIHHMSSMIQSDHIIETVAKELRTKIEKLQERELKYEEAPKNIIERIGTDNAFKASSSGYIQLIDIDSLVSIAEKKGSFFHICFRIGDYIHKGDAILCTEKSFDEQSLSDIQSCFKLGFERMPKDDFEFRLEQLIEICLKALSPGINDAYIAITAIDHLGDALTLLSIRRFPPECYQDSKGKLRVISKRFTYESFVDAAINPIKQNAKSQPMVLIKLVDMLERVLGITEDEEKQAILFSHIKNLYNVGKRNFNDDEDIADLESRMVRIKKTVS